MTFAVLQFPASNCDQDAIHALRDVLGHSARYVWHKEQSLGNADAVVVPGGFCRRSRFTGRHGGAGTLSAFVSESRPSARLMSPT